jgi:hypothetical protein
MVIFVACIRVVLIMYLYTDDKTAVQKMCAVN